MEATATTRRSWAKSAAPQVAGMHNQGTPWVQGCCMCHRRLLLVSGAPRICRRHLHNRLILMPELRGTYSSQSMHHTDTKETAVWSRRQVLDCMMAAGATI